MDHDVITANDFAGEAFLSLNNIPGVAELNMSVENFHGLKAIDLVLMQQRDKREFNQSNIHAWNFWKLSHPQIIPFSKSLRAELSTSQRSTSSASRKLELRRKSPKSYNKAKYLTM